MTTTIFFFVKERKGAENAQTRKRKLREMTEMRQFGLDGEIDDDEIRGGSR